MKLDQKGKEELNLKVKRMSTAGKIAKVEEGLLGEGEITDEKLLFEKRSEYFDY